jgi:two-component system, cell cycle response regulator DivK
MTKLLYVEDNEDNAYMLTCRLRRRGYDVVLAGDGRSGVAMAKGERPALILMDLSLPEMDGWEAIRVLKADEATRAIPVIALSAHAMEDARSRAVEAGCDDFDTKPVELDRLISKMQALLGQ